MKQSALLLMVLAFVLPQKGHTVGEGVLKKFVEVKSAVLNTKEKAKWGEDNVTPVQCAEECLSRPNCASFEMEDTKCFISETDDSTGLASIIPNKNRNYFQRVRPDQEVIVVKKATVPGEDHLGLSRNMNISQCVDKCRETPLCKSFEFKEKARKCDLSNVTHQTHDLRPSKWGWDIYIFNPDYKPIDCGHPPAMDRASVDFDRTDYLADAVYTCESGESHMVHCQENDTWSQPADACPQVVDCGQPVLLGYASVDYNETTYQSKATYRCLMGEEYTVSCRKDGRWSMPTGRCRNPRSCKEFNRCGKNIRDGEYWIYPVILEGQRVKVYCYGMASGEPKEYITLKNENFALSSPLKAIGIFCLSRTVLSRGRPGKTIYDKVRLSPELMTLDISDMKYTSLIDGYGGFKHRFASAEDCLFRSGDRCNSQGAFLIDLQGTGLAIDKSINWVTFGYHARVQSVRRSNNDQKVRGICGGTCGGCIPNKPPKLNILDDDQPNTISAEFCQEM